MERVHLKGEVGVVHQHIHPGKSLVYRPRHLLHLFRSRHVGLKDHSPAARLLHLFQDLRGLVAVLKVVDDDGGASLGQPLCRGGADAPARPRNENDLAAQGHSLLTHLGSTRFAYMATASSAAPFSYLAAFSLKERNFMRT